MIGIAFSIAQEIETMYLTRFGFIMPKMKGKGTGVAKLLVVLNY